MKCFKNLYSKADKRFKLLLSSLNNYFKKILSFICFLLINIKSCINKTKTWFQVQFSNLLNIFFKIKSSFKLSQKRIFFAFQDLKNYTYKGSSWFFYVFFIGFSFFLCNYKFQNYLSQYFNCNIYNLIKIDFDLAQKLMDTSIVSISAIFSISFIIIGFLISILQKYYEDFYDLIYNNIKLFPILYISLSLIGFLIIISSFRQSINPSTFINTSVWGIFLIIIILFFIGYLFNKVIFHIKSKNVYNYISNEIKKYAIRVKYNYKTEKNKKEFTEMKAILQKRLFYVSTIGDIENLDNILSVYEDISLLDI